MSGSGALGEAGAMGEADALQGRLRRVAVFCGSRHGAKPEYTQTAETLARTMTARGLGLVYGGGNVGLMGVVADEVLRGGGEVLGVIPKMLEAREVAHTAISELIVVDTMHDRKRKIYALSEAVIAMPGGIGTFEELFEALTWNQLGIHALPCGLLNVEGYWDPLLAMLDRAVDQGFFPAANRERILSDADPGSLLDRLSAAVE